MKKGSGISAAWHKKHPMPKNPGIWERIEWHLEHIRHCKCRNDIPVRLKEEMKKRGIEIPNQ